MYQKHQISDPLLETKKTKAEEEIAYSTVFKNSAYQAAICFFGTMFHPVYSMVNAAALGHGEETQPLAGLGLGSLTLGICSLSINWTFATGSGIVIAQAYG